MTIKIVTGSLMGRDPFKELFKLYQSGLFYQWYRYTKPHKNTITFDNGQTYWGKIKCKGVSSMERTALAGSTNPAEPTNFINIVQTTGSGKTLLAMIHLHYANKEGRKIAANMDITFGKTKSKVINSFDDFIGLSDCEVLLDDIRHIITAWNSKDAKIGSELANSSRKKGNGINITTQRLDNFVPPDIRMITDEIHVPFIMWFDGEHKAPDWTSTNPHYMPLKICDLRFSAGLEYLDFKIYNLMGTAGKYILDSFSTMQISESIKHEK
jgi:hypothetical protein